MIFPVLEVERLVQVGDKTRLSGVKSFLSQGELVEQVRIQPEATADYVVVTGNQDRDWYLDWAYDGQSRFVEVTLEIKSNLATQSVVKTMSVITDTEDQLFSSDQDLTVLEPDLVRFVPDGRASYLNVHREARDKILEALTDRGLVASSGPLSPSNLLRKAEVRTWARDLTLSLIFQAMSNSNNDVFLAKAKFYASAAEDRSERAILKLDLDGDGKADESTYHGGQVHTRTLSR